LLILIVHLFELGWRNVADGLQKPHTRGPVREAVRLLTGLRLLTCTLIAVVPPTSVPAVAQQPTNGTTLRGYGIDSARLFIQNLGQSVGKECAISCAEAGSPLVILADTVRSTYPSQVKSRLVVRTRV
jgi:hypothetical protein